MNTHHLVQRFDCSMNTNSRQKEDSTSLWFGWSALLVGYFVSTPLCDPTNHLKKGPKHLPVHFLGGFLIIIVVEWPQNHVRQPLTNAVRLENPVRAAALNPIRV